VLQQFKLADIGEGITECEVIKWNVKPQSAIQAFDLLCEVQSDKASVEITSPFDGIVKELLVKEGEVGKVGAGLCLIEVEEEVVDDAGRSALEPVTLPHQEQSVQSTPDVSFPETRRETQRLHPLDPKYRVDCMAQNLENVFATPATRHFAQKNGVNLCLLAPGSGKNGRVEKKDVEAHLANGADVQTLAGTGKDVVVELGRTRYGMWKAMVKSLEIPHFGYSTTLDITELHELLPVLNAHIPPHFLPPPSSPAPPPVSPSAFYPAPAPPSIPSSAQFTRLTYLPILLKTLAKAMVEWPLLRSSITPSSSDSAKPTLTVRPHADINIALSTPTGLYTPTVQSVDTYSIYALSGQLKQLSYLGRQTPCGLSPAEMPKRGGTVTLSNIGAIGAGDYASPVLVPGGGVAIVAVGRAKWVWDVDRGDGKGERRLKLGISWSADHRVVEGAELAAFVECWRGYVEAPARLIADNV
jgi:2-oxoisovalerate dehydrogenase E2 component (dihydrolipoyl transacylase)